MVRAGCTERGAALILKLRSASGERLGQVLGRLSLDDLRRCAEALETLDRAAEAVFEPEQCIRPVSLAAGAMEATR